MGVDTFPFILYPHKQLPTQTCIFGLKCARNAYDTQKTKIAIFRALD